MKIKLSLLKMFRFPKAFFIRKPQLRLPTLRIAVPKIKIRPLRLPVFKLPRVKLPRFTWPRVQMPRFTLPALPPMPSMRFEAPKLSLPQMHMPDPHRLERLKAIALTLFLCVGFGALIVEFSHSNVVRASAVSAVNFLQKAQMEHIAQREAEQLNAIIPASGSEMIVEEEEEARYPVEEPSLEVESVLVPHENTVISSSRDSKIKAINFDNGQLFKKGDVLVEYDCGDIKAEIEIAEQQRELAKKKAETGYKLFKLDIVSDVEKQELESENKQAQARIELYQSRMSDCFIKAEYDGRVVKRLANAGEFTRTDRVLMEVASLDYLKAEFLLPSRWLRWVNVGAPIEISIDETEATYPATIKYIYGEVDPVSRSIQVTAQLDAYDDPLLPGMSGKTVIDVNAIRAQGIYGFLERKSADGQ